MFRGGIGRPAAICSAAESRGKAPGAARLIPNAALAFISRVRSQIGCGGDVQPAAKLRFA